MMKRFLCAAFVTAYVCCCFGAGAEALKLKMEEFHSVSPDLLRIMNEKKLTEQDLWANQEFSSRAWVLHHKPLADFDRGIQNGFWREMHRYPTIAMTGLRLDWSTCRAVRVDLESRVKSNNVITLAFRSDNPEAKGRGYFCFEIPLDFTGKKEVELNFGDAKPLNRPAGWDRITGIYLFAKANGNRPNPYAVMRIDAIRPVPGTFASRPVKPELFQVRLPDRPTPNLNHAWPEDQTDGPVVDGKHFITYQHDGRSERDLFSYYPRYNPGYVSFDPDGKAYISSGELIQWLDGKNWRAFSLRPSLEAWAKKKGYSGLYHNWGAQGGDPAIRFDRKGNMYLLEQVEALDSAGKRYNWHTRTALLLFSPDRLKTIRIYELPLPIASFEKIDGNNPVALDRPPVVMLSDYNYFGGAYHGLKFLQPKQKGDGDGLELGKPVEIAPDTIGCNYHSGDGNIVLSSKDKLFFIWGWLVKDWPDSKRSGEIIAALKKLHPGESNPAKLWTVDNLAQTRFGSSLPKSFPGADAPARNLKFDTRWHEPFDSRFLPASSRDGVPTFISTYDRKTGKMSDPVYVGSAGAVLDDHNWGAIGFDPDGRIEVILNGHHNPPLYTRSKKPYSAEAFEPIRFIQPEQQFERCSYGSLNCDAHGTLYSFFRSTTGTYNNRLVMFRKKPGRPWEPARTIVAPSKLLYHSWMHKATVNPRNNFIYLTYFATPPQSFWPPDYYETMRFTYPELEETLPYTLNPERMALKPVRYWESWVNGGLVQLRGGEPVILVSKDGGDSWHLARSGDFQ